MDVVCGTARYADADQSDTPAVAVTRVRALPFGRNVIARILSYASFLGSAAWHGMWNQRADIVITLTTPPLVSTVGTLLKWMRGSRHFIWEMDIYPDVAIDLGYVARGGIVARVVGLLADLSRQKSDGVVALGECMRDRLIRRGIPAQNIHIAENWADGRLFTPSPIPLEGPAEDSLLWKSRIGSRR